MIQGRGRADRLDASLLTVRHPQLPVLPPQKSPFEKNIQNFLAKILLISKISSNFATQLTGSL